MQAILRPYATAGVSLIGATAIAISPISPVPAALAGIQPASVSSAAVNLVAKPSEFYAELIQRTSANAGLLIDTFLANPTPIMSQVIANQIANGERLVEALTSTAEGVMTVLTEQVPPLLEAAWTALAAGDVETALNTLLDIPVALGLPLLGLIDGILPPFTEAVQNFNNVVQNTTGTIILAGFLGAAGPILSTIGSIGTAVQGVIDAAQAGDAVGVFDALVNAPGILADGFLNGGYGPLLLGFLPAPGLLAPDIGPIAGLLAIRTLIAQQLTGVMPISAASADLQRTQVVEEDGEDPFAPNFASFDMGRDVVVVDVSEGPTTEIDDSTGDIGDTTGGVIEGAGTPGVDPVDGAPEGGEDGDDGITPGDDLDLNEAEPGEGEEGNEEQPPAGEEEQQASDPDPANEPAPEDDDADKTGGENNEGTDDNKVADA